MSPRRPTLTTKKLERQEAIGVIKSVVPYLWPKNRADIKLRVVLSLLALFIGKLIGFAAPPLYGWTVDSMTASTIENKYIMALGIGSIGLTIAYGIARILSVGFNQLRDAVFARVAQRALRQLALETFQHIHALSLRYHITRKTGSLSRIIERGVKGVEFLLRFVLFSIAPLILELILFCLLLLFYFGIWYLLVVASVIALYIWFTFAITEWRVRIRKHMNELDQEANQKAIDSLLNFETVKYFAAEQSEANRYDNSMHGYQKAAIKTAQSLAFLNFGQSCIISVGLMIVMIFAILDVNNGILSLGDFVMINAYMIQIIMPLNFLGTAYREIRQALVDMGEMFTLLKQPPEVVDEKHAPALIVNKGKIEFNNVSFGYTDNHPILSNLNLTINSGETLAVVGSSGSGKTTIGRLLFRFYDVDAGSITIDGQDLRQVTQHSIHQAIGIVPQDTVLFNDTIGYNIAYGHEGASQKDIINVAKSAQIHDFIMQLPNGYQTTVGERGLKLSGGEKQRVGIARTLLKNPPILILDEATSALDTQTERDIQSRLQEMSTGRSVIMIAHRLSTVVEADKIIVLEKGHVIEEGTHDTLIALNGKYAKMWQTQISEEDTMKIS